MNRKIDKNTIHLGSNLKPFHGLHFIALFNSSLKGHHLSRLGEYKLYCGLDKLFRFTCEVSCPFCVCPS